MGFVWLIIGALIGFAIAWYMLKNQCAAQLQQRDREIAGLKSELASHSAEPRAIPQQPSPAASHEPQHFVDRTAGNATSDDLTRIKGIGPALSAKLNGLGIETYRQIAELSSADIERINAQLSFKGRIEREKWVEQAKALVGH